MIVANNIQKYFGPLHVLKNVSLTVQKSEIICIVGKSGAGKSTLLYILGSLDYASNPKESKIIINGEDINSLSENKLAKFRNENIGFIFQFHQLLPEFTALENVLIPAKIANKNPKLALERAEFLLNYLHLNDRKNHKPSQLSGGEQQRVAVARALMNEPKIIFADEPSGNLDSKNAEELHQLFFDLRNEFNQTFVIVTHNEKLAQRADKIFTINDGIINQT